MKLVVEYGSYRRSGVYTFRHTLGSASIETIEGETDDELLVRACAVVRLQGGVASFVRVRPERPAGYFGTDDDLTIVKREGGFTTYSKLWRHYVRT